MIKINGHIVEQRRYPDGTPLLRMNPKQLANDGYRYDVTWLYDEMEELVNISFLVSKIRDADPHADISLECPYVPNARMDREQEPSDVFTLKYFAGILNSLEFSRICSYDVHSSAAARFIDNLEDKSPANLVKAALDDIGIDDIAAFFPDAGARERYAGLLPGMELAYGEKRRDWESGKILGLDIAGMGTEEILGRDFLIIDDICSRGGTFYHAASKLHEFGAGRVFLCVSHCENTVSEGRLLGPDGGIEHIYTSDSIYSGESEKVTAFSLWGRRVA